MIKIIKPTYICLDASITEDFKLGIGLFNITTKEKIALSYSTKTKSSLIAESMALICAMEYAYKKGYEIVHFFTDNKTLGDREIDSGFLEKFPFKDAKISWIPRYLNKEADKMSKAGRNPDSGFWTEAANQPNITEPKEQDKVNKELFNKYSKKQKINFLRKISENNCELEYIRMLDSGEREDYKFAYNGKTKRLIRLSKTMFDKHELSKYARDRLRKMKVQELDKIHFRNEILKRKAL